MCGGMSRPMRPVVRNDWLQACREKEVAEEGWEAVGGGLPCSGVSSITQRHRLSHKSQGVGSERKVVQKRIAGMNRVKEVKDRRRRCAALLGMGAAADIWARRETRREWIRLNRPSINGFEKIYYTQSDESLYRVE